MARVYTTLRPTTNLEHKCNMLNKWYIAACVKKQMTIFASELETIITSMVMILFIFNLMSYTNYVTWRLLTNL